jgi:hypothetical protein
MRVSGSVPSSITITEYGQVAAFGVSAVHDSFSREVCSRVRVVDEFYTLTDPQHRDIVFNVDN